MQLHNSRVRSLRTDIEDATATSERECRLSPRDGALNVLVARQFGAFATPRRVVPLPRLGPQD